MERRKFVKGAILVTGGSLLTPLMTVGRAPKKDTIINVIVDTAQINEGNKNDMTTIIDNRGGSSRNGRHGQFRTDIDAAKWVIWDGQVMDVANNTQDQVLITRIQKKVSGGGKSLLKKDEYTGISQVRAKVRKQYEDGDESYNIHFSVIRAGVRTDYIIDPKLRMRPF